MADDGSADAMIDAIRGEAAARQRLAADVLAGHASGLRRWCLIYGRAADGGEGTDRLQADPKAAAVYKARDCNLTDAAPELPMASSSTTEPRAS